MNGAVELEGMADLIAGVTKLPESADAALAQAVAAGTERTIAALIEAAPRRTGRNIAPGVVSEIAGAGAAIEGTVSLRGIARLVATGTAPHAVAPVQRRALRMPDGRFARRVQHPGSRPNDYFARGAAVAEEAIGTDLDTAVDKLGEEVAAS